MHHLQRPEQACCFCRHAESLGNVNKDAFCHTPDHLVRLTDKGRKQALDGGQNLLKLMQTASSGQPKVFFMTSPYSRTMETTDLLLEAFSDEQARPKA